MLAEIIITVGIGSIIAISTLTGWLIGYDKGYADGRYYAAWTTQHPQTGLSTQEARPALGQRAWLDS